MEYRVEITDVALAEAEDAYVWMMEQLSPESAEKWFDSLMDAIESLNKSPNVPLHRKTTFFPKKYINYYMGKGVEPIAYFLRFQKQLFTFCTFVMLLVNR